MLKIPVKSMIPTSIRGRVRRLDDDADPSCKHSSGIRSMIKGFVPRMLEFVHQRKRASTFRGIFRRYRDYTMIREKNYVCNLALASQQEKVAGCVVECGVWRGGMIAGIADVLGGERDYFLFDSFQGLPPAKPIDGKQAADWQANKEGPRYFDNCTASVNTAEQAMKLSSAQRVHIVPGWFEETLPRFQPPQPIALLRLDGDWYDSTMTCLTHLHKQMAKDGIIVLDDYYAWDGCSRAVHDFLSSQGLPWRVWQFDNIVCFIRVP